MLNAVHRCYFGSSSTDSGGQNRDQLLDPEAVAEGFIPRATVQRKKPSERGSSPLSKGWYPSEVSLLVTVDTAPLARRRRCISFFAHQRGSIYSLDEGRRDTWTKPLREHVDKLQRGKGESGKKYSYRLVGSAVADVHRTLVSRGFSRGRPPCCEKRGPDAPVLMRNACAQFFRSSRRAG